MENIGERLKKWRKDNKLTTTEIAKKTGISAGGLSEYENNKKLIGSKTLISLYEEYRIDIAYILTGEKQIELNENKKELLEIFDKVPEREQIKIIGALEEKYKIIEEQSKSSTSKIG